MHRWNEDEYKPSAGKSKASAQKTEGELDEQMAREMEIDKLMSAKMQEDENQVIKVSCIFRNQFI